MFTFWAYCLEPIWAMVTRPVQGPQDRHVAVTAWSAVNATWRVNNRRVGEDGVPAGAAASGVRDDKSAVQ